MSVIFLLCSLLPIVALLFMASDVGLVFFAPLLNGIARRCGLQKEVKIGDEYVGKQVLVLEAIAPDCAGKIELNGVIWNARLAAGHKGVSVATGSYVVIKGMERLTFLVEGEED